MGAKGPEGLVLSNWKRSHGAGTASICRFVPTVPTVPPGNVQAEAINSTTIRFTWNPPSPQFINGINQGYKVRGDCHRSPQNQGNCSEENHCCL